MISRKTLVLFLVVLAVSSAKKAHRKKHEKKSLLKEDETSAEDIFASFREGNHEKKEHKFELENELDSNVLNHDAGGFVEDPCAKHKCGPGKICEINDGGEAKCVCISQCPEEKDERRKVCSNHNETWTSDCELYQMRCFCTEGMESCKRHKYKHVHVDYFGPCKDIGECEPDELEDFPRRMREWLFNVMQDLARREELHGASLRLEKEAERSHSRKWVNAVIWKFCDLDVHPHDRKVSRHELFPIRAPLLAMEHCIAPFLDGCDEDDDHMISLVEWGKCLGLKEDEIQDKCPSVNKNKRG